ncbi:MAG: VCBS repeat-containing protein, partial [Phycisphaerales bacterium]|nr:VCBS repeat-containing protein [Phycisphaerales bacterium]
MDLVALLAIGAQAQVTFTDVTASSGIDFTHAPFDVPGEHALMIGGAAALDVDGDGRLDLVLLAGGGRPDALYRNQGDGTFLDEAALWGLDTPHRGAGVCAGDVDRDGDLDLYMTSYGPVPGARGPGRHRLLLNTGHDFID